MRLRNLVLLSVMLLVFVTLIIGIHFTNRGVQLILPEARQARIDRAKNHDANAYYTMLEAIQLLPNRPGTLWMPDPKMTEVKYVTESLSIGQMMRMRRPDDDPELQAYLKNAKSAIDRMKGVTEKPYFLCDFPVLAGYFYHQTDFNAGGYLLAHLGYARSQIEYWDDAAGGFESLGELWDILKLMQTGLIDQGGYYGTTYNLWRDYFRTLQHYYRKFPNPDMRRSLRTLLESQPPPYEDMQNVLHSNLGSLDETLLYPDYIVEHGGEIDGNDMLTAYQLQSVANYFRENLSRFREITDLAPHEYEDNITSPIWEPVLWSEHFGMYQVTLILQKLVAAHQINGYQIATKLSFDIEDYKTLHGSYPETLDALVPEILDELPINPVSGKHFLMVPNGSAYNLADPRFYLFQVDGQSEVARPAYYVEGGAFKEPEELR